MEGKSMTDIMRKILKEVFVKEYLLNEYNTGTHISYCDLYIGDDGMKHCVYSLYPWWRHPHERASALRASLRGFLRTTYLDRFVDDSYTRERLKDVIEWYIRKENDTLSLDLRIWDLIYEVLEPVFEENVRSIINKYRDKYDISFGWVNDKYGDTYMEIEVVVRPSDECPYDLEQEFGCLYDSNEGAFDF